MAAAWKLQKLAKARGMSERALVIEALESSQTYEEAAAKLGISRQGVRKAVRRYEIPIMRPMVVKS